MGAHKFGFVFRGITPLLLDVDDVEWADTVKAWQKNKDNKAKSVAGDDRSPAWKWLGALPRDGTSVAIGSETLFSCFRLAGQKIPTGKGTASFKSSVAAFLDFDSEHYPLRYGSPERTLACADVAEMMGNESFPEHQRFAAQNGFRLFVKRARPQSKGSKHVRVRPAFDTWSIAGTVTVFDDVLSENFASVCETAGKRVGLGNWRPGLPVAPGNYGKFRVELKAVS